MPSTGTLLIIIFVLFLIWKGMKYVDFEAAFNAASSEELKVVGPAPPKFPGFIKVANLWFVCYYREASRDCRMSVLHITVRGRVGTLTLVFNEARHSLLEVHRD